MGGHDAVGQYVHVHTVEGLQHDLFEGVVIPRSFEDDGPVVSSIKDVVDYTAN